MTGSATNGDAREPLLLLGATALAVAVSAIRPHDPIVWILEAGPVLVAAPILVFTWRRFPLTPLTYRLIFAHALVLLLGAHYTYSRVPLGFWMQDWLELSRNHYDRLGHVAQGFVPALIAREILVRTSPLVPGRWLFFLSTCVALAISAFYEMLEWWAAVVGEQAADAFLATQGDVWDTQWDMFLALLGAIAALALLGRVQQRQIEARAP